MIERIDKLNFEDNSVIKEKIGDESIYYSDKIQKKRMVLFLKFKKEIFLLQTKPYITLKEMNLKEE